MVGTATSQALVKQTSSEELKQSEMAMMLSLKSLAQGMVGMARRWCGGWQQKELPSWREQRCKPRCRKEEQQTEHVDCRLTCGQRPRAMEGVSQESSRGEGLGQDLMRPSRDGV